MSSFDITKVKKLTKEDLVKTDIPKITLEGIKDMCNFLDEENPTTYEIFLKYRPDLSSSEVDYYKGIIETLKENIKLKQSIISQTCMTYEECSKVEPNYIVVNDVRLNSVYNPC
jgi:hypothetical protein